jgi:hypothetical protein
LSMTKENLFSGNIFLAFIFLWSHCIFSQIWKAVKISNLSVPFQRQCRWTVIISIIIFLPFFPFLKFIQRFLSDFVDWWHRSCPRKAYTESVHLCNDLKQNPFQRISQTSLQIVQCSIWVHPPIHKNVDRALCTNLNVRGQLLYSNIASIRPTRWLHLWTASLCLRSL